MSTNTTSTNNGNGTGNGASRPKSSGSKSAANAEGARYYPFGSMPLPDPETLERLANEFFLAVPKDLANGDSAEEYAASPDVESEEIPTVMFTEEMLPAQRISLFESAPSVPGSVPSTPPGPLTESDLRAIAASLAGSMALVPGTPGTAPMPPVAGSPPGFFAEGNSSPLSVAPKLPTANELFSFPGMPTMLSSPPTSPPGGADMSALPQSPGSVPTKPGSAPYSVEGEKGTSPAAASLLPPISELFSFPRVPAMPNVSGIETIPNVPAPPTSPSAAPPDATMTTATGLGQPHDVKAVTPTVPATTSPEMSGVPSTGTSGSSGTFAEPAKKIYPRPTDSGADQSHDVKAVTPAVPGMTTPELRGIQSTSSPASSGTSANPERAIYPGAATSLPSLSELFSFPGVPGAQSAPGVPAFPSSTSAPPSAEADLRKATPHPSVPGLGVPALGDVAGTETAAPHKGTQTAAETTAAAPRHGAYEFRPDVVPEDLGVAKRPLDAKLIRRDFPILEERVHGRPLIWLDNAATTQKPNAVIDRISDFYRHENSNIHRAAHELAARATDAYESAREKTRRFLNASTTREIIFVRGATEGINLIAQTWGRRNVREGDEIVITWLEHHANIVPWQMLCSEKGARLRVAPVNDRGEIILEEYERLLGPRTKIVSLSQVSNALGTITPAREMVEIAHRYGARVVVDGAQAVSHMPVDVQALDCDFYIFSGHKVFGPTGIGVVFGKLDVLDAMPPWQGGGNMIADVTFEKTTYQPAPARFEAGTGNIADAVGLGAALDYVSGIGMENIAAYEHELLNYGTAKLLTVPGLRLIGTAREKAGVMSFVLDEVRTEDVGVALNQEGIAVRSGHHCAQPILRRMGVESSVRPSLAFYNTCEEIDALVAALLRFQAGRGHRKL
jgi:cysteine desulfurase / selenocysteine lyase